MVRPLEPHQDRKDGRARELPRRQPLALLTKARLVQLVPHDSRALRPLDVVALAPEAAASVARCGRRLSLGDNLEGSLRDGDAVVVCNPDGSIAVVVFNEGKTAKSFDLKLDGISKNISISPQAIQTINLSNPVL